MLSDQFSTEWTALLHPFSDRSNILWRRDIPALAEESANGVSLVLELLVVLLALLSRIVRLGVAEPSVFCHLLLLLLVLLGSLSLALPSHEFFHLACSAAALFLRVHLLMTRTLVHVLIVDTCVLERSLTFFTVGGQLLTRF